MAKNHPHHPNTDKLFFSAMGGLAIFFIGAFVAMSNLSLGFPIAILGFAVFLPLVITGIVKEIRTA